MTYYKWLLKGRKAANGGTGTWSRGWMKVEPPLVPCYHGLHICEIQDIAGWIPDKHGVLWEVEVAPDAEIIRHGDNKTVVSKARLVRMVGVAGERNLRLFACDCAAHVLPLFEKKYPDDKRPRKAIAVARRYANGKATPAELDAAGDAAGAAAGAAAGDAAGAAAWDAAGAAAGAAAGDAAGAAAWAAAWDAAEAAAGAAAWVAAGAAEKVWQGKRLIKVLSK